ncbi:MULTISPECIES: amidohydrolase family protein [Caulobacter]|uniref:Amidohydrolase, imidazolonepropionase n=1 Tax=Caulobacter vibrioides OR37 TaxID=1292034 RepID=R0D1G9_CAUVI|nr:MULTISPECIES: amidohydrolase family protein [Caulobacter]ENZ82501.1 amidohydrolase, imidazolonepropionase [Caulobacter vibrioides OR37]
MMKPTLKSVLMATALAGTLGLAGVGIAQAAKAGDGEVVAIVGATVFDATGAAPHLANVVIRDGRIAEVGPTVKAPRGAKVIDAKGEALLPGFFDLHTHWTPSGVPGTTPQIATAYVSSGVTTVSDFNAAPESFAPRRQWLSTLVAPHVNFAARMSTPGGHGADWADTATTKWVNTPEAARAAVKSLIPYKPDLIKAFTDGWRYGVAPDNTSMDEWTLTALVDEAHKNNLKVFTHTVTVDRGEVAGRSKVDVITHSLQDRRLDAEAVEIIKAGGTSDTPTLAVYEPVKPGQPPRDPDENPNVKQSFKKFDNALHNAKMLHDAGVTIALGTDAGMPGTPHGASTLHEMELMVRAGLTPTDALMAGTAFSAKVINLLSDRGTIEVGKRADLVLIKGEPWKTISDVRKTDRVLIDGKLVYGPGAPALTANQATTMPSIPAKAQIDDFERADGRSSLDTLRTDDPDGGLDRTVEISQVITRGEQGHALSISARMSMKPKPYAGVIIPLTRGSIQPVDARAFKGVRFEVRGDGDYALGVSTAGGRWSAPFSAGQAWKTVEIPFTALKPASERGGKSEWTGSDLTEVEFMGGRKGGEKIWMEVDNVTFY